MRTPENANRWERIDELFHAALALDSNARQDFLRQACANNSELLHEIQSLLESSQQTLAFARNAVAQVAHEQKDADATGKRVGAYQLLKSIGEGGMGTVYLATRADEAYQQQVAIKLMHPAMGFSQGLLLRFSAERQILANLNHANIARLLDGGMTSDGIPYLAMEYIEGVPIDQYCYQNKLSVPARLKLFHTVCDAVAYAHKNLVVHRDIKPGNILVTSEGVPKLLDFGIAKLLDAEGSGTLRTRTSERLMTLEYASPEQIRGDAITTATDVYALGVLLYELLAERRPFDREERTPLQMVQVICEQQPDPPSKAAIAPGSPSSARDTARILKGDLDDIVLMAIRKEPQRRYASVSALSRDVEAYLTGYSVQARPDTWSYRSGKFVRRHKVAVPMAILAVLALVGFSVGMGLFARRADQARRIAEERQVVVRQEADFLEGIFDDATPQATKGRVVTARDLIDDAAKRFETDPPSNPEAQATILDDLGFDYLAFSDFSRAEQLLSRSHELRTRKVGHAFTDNPDSADMLARAYFAEGHADKAEPLFREAVSIAQKNPGGGSSSVAEILTGLGQCLWYENKDVEAESVLKQAIALNHRTDDSHVARERSYLSEVLARKGDIPGALDSSRQAVEITTRLEGPNSPNLALQLGKFGGQLAEAGDFSEAENTERRSLDLYRRVDASSMLGLTSAMDDLGLVLLAKGNPKQAEPFLQQALALRRQKLGDKDSSVAISFFSWGRLLQAKGDYAGAEKSFRQALQVMTENWGPEDWDTVEVVDSLAMLRLEVNDYSGAESYCKQALETRKKLGGDEHYRVAGSLIDLALIRELQGDTAGAEPLLRSALAIRKKSLPPNFPLVVEAETRLGETLIAEGKPEAAEPILREAVKSVQQPPFPLQPWQVAEPEHALGVCLAKLHRDSEASPLLNRSRNPLESYPQSTVRKWILTLRPS